MKKYVLIVILVVFTAAGLWTPALSAGGTAARVVRRTGAHRHHRRQVRVHYQRRRRGYVRHRTKWQHAKIIGGAAKTGASIGGMVGGPPGMAAGAAGGAAAGTAYDVKTRKKPPK